MTSHINLSTNQKSTRILVQRRARFTCRQACKGHLAAKEKQLDELVSTVQRGPDGRMLERSRYKSEMEKGSLRTHVGVETSASESGRVHYSSYSVASQ